MRLVARAYKLRPKSLCAIVGVRPLHSSIFVDEQAPRTLRRVSRGRDVRFDKNVLHLHVSMRDVEGVQRTQPVQNPSEKSRDCPWAPPQATVDGRGHHDGVWAVQHREHGLVQRHPFVVVHNPEAPDGAMFAGARVLEVRDVAG